MKVLMLGVKGVAANILAHKVRVHPLVANANLQICIMSESDGMHALDKFDMVLLSPMLRFLKERIIACGVCVAIIESSTFGQLDADMVCKAILDTLVTRL